MSFDRGNGRRTKGIKESNFSVKLIYTSPKKSCNGALISYVFRRERVNIHLKIFIYN